MEWSEWIDFETIKALSKHASGIIPGLVFFWAFGALVDELVYDEPLKHILHKVDGFILIGLVLWLAFQTGCILWKHRERNGSKLGILVA